MDYYQASSAHAADFAIFGRRYLEPRGAGHSALPWQELVVTFGFITAG